MRYALVLPCVCQQAWWAFHACSYGYVWHKMHFPNCHLLQISTFDPVDVAVPRYQALSGSFSTLLHSFDKLSSVKQLRTASSLSNHTDSCMDSECHLSDAEGYIMCRDCPGSSCSEIKTCHHCQMNTDGHDTTTMQHELHRQSSCSSYHL